MRKEVLNAWQQSVYAGVARSFPNFGPLRGRVRPEPPGLVKFHWRPRDGLNCFIAFRPIESEAFDVYAGWSTKDKSAVTVISSTPANSSSFSALEYFNVSSAYSGRQGLVHWNFWSPSDVVASDPALFANEYARHFLRVLSPEEARELVEPSVSSALEEIGTYCIPYLESRVKVA